MPKVELESTVSHIDCRATQITFVSLMNEPCLNLVYITIINDKVQTMNCQPNSHTNCQAAQVNVQTKAWQRVCLSHPDKIELKKSSLPSENKRYATAQADTTKTMKRSFDNELKGRRTEHQPVTAVWRNGGCSASYDSLVVSSSSVLRLNFCAKNPPLRQAPKRYA